MKLKDGRGAYYSSSRTVSQTTRQLGLAGIAVVWLLAGGLKTSGVNLTTGLLAAGACLVFALILDLAQYVWTTATFAIWVRGKEKAKRQGKPAETNVDEEEIGDAPDFILPIMWVLFFVKVAAVAGAYGVLINELVGRIHLS